MICIQFVSQDMDAGGKGLNRRVKSIVPTCATCRYTKNPKQRIRFGALSPQTVIRLLTGEPVYESFGL